MTSHNPSYRRDPNILFQGSESPEANEEDCIFAVQCDTSVLISSERYYERSGCALQIHIEGSAAKRAIRAVRLRAGV